MATTGDDLATARTLLFVPGDRPERFPKAAVAGADVVVLDLEDAVPPGGKEMARTEVKEWLGRGNAACVRVNGAGTPWHLNDVAALEDAAGLAGVLLPMADDPGLATALHQRLEVPVLALVETARGVLRCVELADAEGVARLALGALDLAVDLRTDDADTVARVRTQLVLGSRAAGLEGPVDSVTTDLSDGGVAGRDAKASKAAGMGGKFCVHPRQVAPVAAAFAPMEAELEWARRVLEVAVDGEVTVVDGQMVDAPVLARARRILAEA